MYYERFKEAEEKALRIDKKADRQMKRILHDLSLIHI